MSQAAIIWTLATVTLVAAAILGVYQKRRAEQAKAEGVSSAFAETQGESSQDHGARSH